MTYEMYHRLFRIALRRTHNNQMPESVVQSGRYLANTLWLHRIDCYWLEQWALEDAVYTYQTTMTDPYE